MDKIGSGSLKAIAKGHCVRRTTCELKERPSKAYRVKKKFAKLKQRFRVTLCLLVLDTCQQGLSPSASRDDSFLSSCMYRHSCTGAISYHLVLARDPSRRCRFILFGELLRYIERRTQTVQDAATVAYFLNYEFRLGSRSICFGEFSLTSRDRNTARVGCFVSRREERQGQS